LLARQAAHPVSEIIIGAIIGAVPPTLAIWIGLRTLHKRVPTVVAEAVKNAVKEDVLPILTQARP